MRTMSELPAPRRDAKEQAASRSPTSATFLLPQQLYLHGESERHISGQSDRVSRVEREGSGLVPVRRAAAPPFNMQVHQRGHGRAAPHVTAHARGHEPHLLTYLSTWRELRLARLATSLT